MDAETQAVLFNAVPLLLVAALYLVVGLTLAPALWRDRERSRFARMAMALVYPAGGTAAGIIGIEVLTEEQPLGGHQWLSLAAILLAAVPALALLPSWRDQGVVISGTRRTREAEQRLSLRDRELESVGRLARALLDAADTESIARALLDELAALFELDVANLCLVEGEARQRARIVVARDGGRDNEALMGQVVDLDRETSGISTAVREAVAFSVYDAEVSPIVNQRLNEIARVKSCAFVPVIAAERVIGVVFAAVRHPRVFGEDELALMQSFAAEAGLALERVESAAALEEALERERLIARFSLELRSQRDLDELLRVAVTEIAKAVGVVRCFIRLGEPGGPMPVVAEWEAEGAPPLGDASRLPVSNLAARERRTIVIGDVLEAAELDHPELGDLSELLDRGERASLSTPVVAFDRLIGVLGLHRSEPTDWTAGEIALAEAVAREAAIQIDAGRLLRASDRRVAEQRALLKAGEALTSDLRFDAVIERLVTEILALVHGDAADCWTFLPGGHELVCRAVLGLPESEVGRRVPVQGTIGEAIKSGRPVLRRDFASTEQPPPDANHSVFAEVMYSPIYSFGEIRGVLGVWSHEPRRFEESDLRLIEAFASLASVALRNAEVYEESRRQTHVERAFYRIAAVLSEPLSAEATLDAVAQAASEALGGDSAAVLRTAGGELELAGAHDLAPGLAAYFGTEASGLIAAAKAGKVLASRRLRDDGRFDEALARAAEEADRTSMLAVPLAQPREGFGIVLVFFRNEELFDDDQLELAGHVAGAARGALERSELYERERRSRSLAQQLARAGRELAGELDPDTVLDQCARLAAELVEADGASVRMLEDDEVVVRAAAGAGEAQALGARTPSTAWLVGDIVQTRATRSIADVRADPRIGQVDAMLAAGYAAYLGVPIVGPDGSAQGILAVYGERPRDWLEEEAEALQTLAATAAAARANADLYEEVSNQQQRSEAILANVADGIVAVDREGKVVLWNTAAERVTGVSQSEALGRTPAEALGRSLDSEDMLGGSRLVPIRRGGEEVWLSLSEAVMTDPAGAVAGRIYAFRDISSELRVEQMKSGFVSTVSHELRTPLTSIYGFAETLLRQDVLFGEEERSTFLRYISSESERLMSIVDRLLSVAEADSGAIPIQLGEVDVGAVVSDAVRAAESGEGQKGTRFVLALPEEKLAAQADGEKLGQVLSHLLDNAVRYSPEGGTVTVAARKANGFVEVSVEDEGAGIPHAEQELIFRKLYRGDAVAGAVGAGATGLGLFLAKAFVDAMDGKIRVDSQEGRGSTFVLELRPAGSEA